MSDACNGRTGHRHRHHDHHAGFTIVELLVVVGGITILAGILLVGLTAVRKQGLMTVSQSSMRQIGLWMRQYSSDNREIILPSQFDYSANPIPGKVRSGTVATGNPNTGTWADILWTTHGVAEFADDPNYTYRYDSPDQALYDRLADWDDNPLRSAGVNTRDAESGPGSLPTPYGPGASEAGSQGYFAANNFFNTENGYYTTGQIRAPERSIYLIDSFAGETIEPEPGPWEVNPALAVGDAANTQEVDFRYNSVCLMLFLDGHVEPEGEWNAAAGWSDDLCFVELELGHRVRNLNERQAPCSAPAP